MFVALAAALAIVGFATYALVSNQLEETHVDELARAQRADVASFEALRNEFGPRATLREIDEALELIGRRPGTTEASLVGPDGTIVVSSDSELVGTADDNEQIVEALRDGVSRAGREEDPGEDASDFEFIDPVELEAGRHVLETSFASETFDAQLADLRRTLIIVGIGALLATIGLFYLFGGRALLRSHRRALLRATLDGLTDLPNQRAFQIDFEQATAFARRSQDALSLAVFDVDHFKLVNDRFGHPQGDALLQRVAGVLGQRRAADRAYRIGGDEFALLMPNTDSEGARTVIRRVLKKLADADAAVSAGVATLRPGEPETQLRGEADAALYEAKRRGGAQLVEFAEIRDAVSVTTAEKRRAIERIVAEEHLRTVFQPIWNFDTRELIGIEALARPDASYGFAGPAEMFDVADEIGAVHALDVVCAKRSLKSARELSAPDDALLFLNLAPRTLEQDAGVDDWLHRAVEQAGLRPESVVVEVTERLGSRVAPVIKSLERLRELGFGIALDDVGTGNSGLEMLRQVDADFVKIDRSIVAAAPTEPNARAVLMAMATFAGQTGAFVIAEGIEDDETLEFLRSMDRSDLQRANVIQGGQGFGLGRPEPVLPHDAPRALGRSSGQALVR
jgi:diguanylate cyclase (GGDEF)-like protein